MNCRTIITSIVALGAVAATCMATAPTTTRRAPASRRATLPNVKREPVTLDLVQRLYRERDARALSNLRRGDLQALPLADRNAIALLAAANLDIKEYVKGPVPADFLAFLRTKPPNDPIWLQWSMNRVSSEILGYLAGRPPVTESRVIPYLIAALDHPDKAIVGRQCWLVLQDLARHREEPSLWESARQNPDTHARIVTWWREWWKTHQDRHPIFDAALEDQARTRVLDILRLIEKDVKPKFWEFGAFTVPQKDRILFGDRPPLYTFTYEPDVLANPPMPRERLGVLPRVEPATWLEVRATFGTPPMATGATRARSRAPRFLAKGLEDRIETVYIERLPGTDVEIVVTIATLNGDLPGFMRIALEDRRPGKQ